MLRAGDLNQRITIQARATTQNETGEPTGTWSTTATVWAQVEVLSGRELFVAQQDASLVQYRVTLRHRTGLTAAMRVVWGARILDIEAAPGDDGRREQTILLCLERKAGA